MYNQDQEQDPVEVTPTRVQTFRITRKDNTQITVVASDDAQTLETFAAKADKKVLIKRTDMEPEKQ